MLYLRNLPYKQMIEHLNRTYKQSYRPTNGFHNIDGANYEPFGLLIIISFVHINMQVAKYLTILIFLKVLTTCRVNGSYLSFLDNKQLKTCNSDRRVNEAEPLSTEPWNTGARSGKICRESLLT